MRARNNGEEPVCRIETSYERLRQQFQNPENDYSPVPFWFWNDKLDRKELFAQMADFREKGVYAFVIHPRIGLPDSIGFLSDSHLAFIRDVIVEARRTGMKVWLYDEGMYPSGSAHGLVVKQNPAYASRGLKVIEVDPGSFSPGQSPLSLIDELAGERLLAVQIAERLSDERLRSVSIRQLDHEMSPLWPTMDDEEKEENSQPIVLLFVEHYTGGVIRGIHYGEDSNEPLAPPYPDVLNPEVGKAFVSIVYETYLRHFGEYFGETIQGIFTDEPHALGKKGRLSKGGRPPVPWTDGMMKHIEQGGVAQTDLAWIWYDSDTGIEHQVRRNFERVVQNRIAESFYKPISNFCKINGIALCGHPMKSDDFGMQSYFHIPGQDVVLRKLEPGNKSALQGADSTQAKCSADSARLLARRRNSNECFGGYGWSLTVADMKWIMDWLFVRGVNLLYPHAFYYSVRGPRADERPPDVGPNNLWWPHYRRISDYIKRMSWLNTESVNPANVAVLTDGDHLSWKATMPLFKNQIAFHYVEQSYLHGATVEGSGWITIAGYRYRVIVLPDEYVPTPTVEQILERLQSKGVLILGYGFECGKPYIRRIDSAEVYTSLLDKTISRDIVLRPPCADLRVSLLNKEGCWLALLTNEGEYTYDGICRFPQFGKSSFQIWDGWSGRIIEASTVGNDGSIRMLLGARESKVVSLVPDMQQFLPQQQSEDAFQSDYRWYGSHSSLTHSYEQFIAFDRQWAVKGLSGVLNTEQPFGSWSRMPGYERFSGTIVFSNKVKLTSVSGDYILDCGEVNDFAEIRVNQRLVDVLFWPPYAVRITDFLLPGSNRIEIAVTNSMANHYENADKPSGLLSGVQLIHRE